MEPLLITCSNCEPADEIVITCSTTTGTAAWPYWNKTWKATKTWNAGGCGADASTTGWTNSTWERKTAKTWSLWVNQLYAPNHALNQTSCTTTLDPWPHWVTNSTTMTGGGCGTVVVTDGAAIESVRPQISDEEYQRRRREQQRLNDEREQRWAAEKREREVAKGRAQILLRESLTDEQKAELAEKRYFTLQVIDSQTGARRNYRIHQGRARNVEQVDDNGRRLRTLCAHPAIDCPDEDTMLAQKLWLEHREADFLRVANHS